MNFTPSPLFLTIVFCKSEKERKNEKEQVSESLWGSFFTDPKEALDLLVDPNKREREEEARLKKEVKASKRAWRNIRQQQFKFLDSGNDASVAGEGSVSG